MRSSSHKSGKQTVTQTDSKTAAASTLVTMTMPYSNSIALRACSLVAFFVLPSSIALTYLFSLTSTSRAVRASLKRIIIHNSWLLSHTYSPRRGFST